MNWRDRHRGRSERKLALPERARSIAARHPGLRVERLEDRVLLASGTALTASIVGSSTAISAAPIVIEPIIAPVVGVSVVSPPAKAGSIIAPLSVAPVASATASTHPPSAAPVAPVPTTGQNNSGTPTESTGSDAVPPNISQGDQPPLIVDAPSDPSVPPITVSYVNALAGGEVPVLPVGGNVELQGTLNAAHSTEVLAIPVEPSVEKLTIDVQSAVAPSNREIPVISRILLINANKLILSEWSANLDQVGGPPQFVSVTVENAPLGAHLLVQISTVSAPYANLNVPVGGTSPSLSSAEPTNTTAEARDSGAPAATQRAPDSGASSIVATRGTGNPTATGSTSETATRSTSETATGSTSETATGSTSETATGSPSATQVVLSGTSATEVELANSSATQVTGLAGTNLSTVNTTGASFVGTWTAASPSQQSVSWSLPFIVDVQLQEQQVTTAATMATGLGQSTIGTLAVETSGASTSSNTLQTLSTTDVSLSTAISAPAISATLTNSTVADQSTDMSDGFNERVPTGPFASRSASPLGPIIASSMSDPTSPVDRHERALLQDMEGIGTQDETVTFVHGNELVNAGGEDPVRIEDEPRALEMDEDDGLVVVVSGRGGFPLKATAPAAGRRHADLAALLAVLPGTSDLNAEIPVASSEELSLNEAAVALAAVSTSPADAREEFPDYLRAACGLAIGLGLTAGPLFPDLMQSLRGRVPKWIIGRRPRRGNGGN